MKMGLYLYVSGFWFGLCCLYEPENSAILLIYAYAPEELRDCHTAYMRLKIMLLVQSTMIFKRFKRN